MRGGGGAWSRAGATPAPDRTALGTATTSAAAAATELQREIRARERRERECRPTAGVLPGQQGWALLVQRRVRPPRLLCLAHPLSTRPARTGNPPPMDGWCPLGRWTRKWRMGSPSLLNGHRERRKAHACMYSSGAGWLAVWKGKNEKTGNPKKKKKQEKGDTNSHQVSECSCLRLTACLQPRSVMCVCWCVVGVVWVVSRKGVWCMVPVPVPGVLRVSGGLKPRTAWQLLMGPERLPSFLPCPSLPLGRPSPSAWVACMSCTCCARDWPRAGLGQQAPAPAQELHGLFHQSG